MTECKIEALLRAWLSAQEGYFGNSKGVIHADGSETGVDDPLFDGALDVKSLASFLHVWVVRKPVGRIKRA